MPPAAARSRERLAWIAALSVSLATLAAMAAAYLGGRSVEPQEVRLQMLTPDGRPADLAISPDGRNVVFSATVDDRTDLWVRSLNAAAGQRVAGTTNGEYPFWSPDGRSIGFFADQKLKRVEVASGTVQMLTDASAARGGAWGDGVILFAPANISPLFRIPARGGSPEPATRLEAPQQASHRLPVFLPDGRRFIFFVNGTPAVEGMYAGSLDSQDTRRVFESESAGVFTAPDLILFRREEALMGVRVDLRTLDPIGDPFPVGDKVAGATNIVGRIAASGSAAGSFVYRPAVAAPRQLVWFDRAGHQLEPVGQPDQFMASGENSWRLSPDGRSVIVSRRINNNNDLWLIDTTRGALRRLTSDPASDSYPLWSPDGSRLTFGSARLHGSVVHDVFEESLTGTSTETLLLGSAENKAPEAWSPDGRFLVYSVLSPKTGADLWVLPLQDKKPFAFVQTAAIEVNATFSPDGHWLAYQSTETGPSEIFVQAFPGPARSTLVSNGGGQAPVWRGDGREIFYRTPDGRLMAVPVSFNVDGVNAGAPTALFTMRPGATFRADRSGQRFLINMPLEAESAPPITVVLNWRPPQ